MDGMNSDSSDDGFEELAGRFLTTAVKAASLLNQNQASTSTSRVRGPPLNRDRMGAYERLQNDYLSENPVYNDDHFRRRFRMSLGLFKRIVADLEANYEYFQWRWDHRGKQGFAPIQKCTAAIKQLGYGVASDSLDEYLQMSEKTARDSLHNFCQGIISLYGRQYLRKPSYDDVQRLYAAHESKHGFVGMLGSIDCTHWSWATCPVAWRGQYMRGDHDGPTIILQAVASHDLWIWDAYFGIPGSNNDINVLNSSPVIEDLVTGRIPSCPFQVNGAFYSHGYYLADGIYPEYAAFVKSFTCPQDDKRIKFKSAQESARKDVERAFGVLKQRWHILKNPARTWTIPRLQNIMYACIILHNMILQDEGHAICAIDPNEFVPEDNQLQLSEEDRAIRISQIRSREIHNNLRADLVEHISTLSRN